ncbi:hypothetical protein [Streptomyces sp. 3214.6]|uniref:hypothetical protein n=1 Tax=Streptomyces sp. 3214.6 TaxID=1882757 RepID=UPI00090CA295|nr:hypothetical protein [Streptomyces sp. 3214.6]SHH32925.1 hypothetical protein SAMN05444521_0141 [Streptomyces sp. 3214.6]
MMIGMNEQWAGVVGAVAGGVLAGVPALLSARWSRQSQREQTQAQHVLLAGQLQSAHLLQMMEPRRRVYGDFIAAVHQLRSKLYEAWGRGHGDGYGPMLVVLEDEELSRRLEHVRAQIALEGPEPVVAAAESVMELISALYAHVFSVEESGIMGEFAAAGEEVAAPEELAELKQRLDSMITAARQALAEYGTTALLPSIGR